MVNKIPSIVITGASGFVGRALLDDLKDEYRIFAMARRSQYECNAPVHSNIAWIRADISDYQSISRAFREVETAGGADYLFHLAAYYDFTGQDRPEYRDTNVEGTRYILELAEKLHLKLFVFVSSVAACSFPKRGEVVDESSQPDGDEPYSWSKREGEALVRQHSDRLPGCIVRMGAIFSDWCEYPPLYMFLNTWLGHSWEASILAGKGESAIPYIHIRDIVSFFRTLLLKHERIRPAQVLVACSKGCTDHEMLFTLATRYFYGTARRAIHMPRFLCGIGLWLKYIWGKILNNVPFERPWMRYYIDRQLNVDNSNTCALLGWDTQPRHVIERRVAFMVDRIKSEPFEWLCRNLTVLRKGTARPDLCIYTALSNIESEIINSLVDTVCSPEAATIYPNFQKQPRDELVWFVKLLYRLLLTSVHASNRMMLLHYFEISGTGRFQAGFTGNEITAILTALQEIILEQLGRVEDLKSLKREFYDFVSMPLELGKDEVAHQYQLFKVHGAAKPSADTLETKVRRLRQDEPRSSREQLEETIWTCLVHRK